MACYAPLDAARPVGSDEAPLIYAKGRRPSPLAKGWEALQLPCGQCIGCRLEYSRTWAVRIMHESQLHEFNAFVTLTYDDDHLPTDGGLNKDHVQRFLKRLRKWAEGERARNLTYTNERQLARGVRREEGGAGIRYFLCGEYGETFDRPHFHLCLFGVHFTDSLFLGSEGEHDLYSSETLNRLWGKGFAVIGQLTFESAAYVARYVVKKVTGPRADEHYMRDDPLTGQVRRLPPEFATMSRRPGIAAGWFDEFEKDVYPWDEVITRGRPTRPPRYYDKRLEETNPELYYQVKRQREERAKEHEDNNTPARLEVREKVKKAQLNMLTRRIEK